MPGVRVRWARSPADLDGAHWIVLPGSKHTSSDLAWLRAQRLAPAIAAHARRGGAVLGICGGLQMLGEALVDPHGIDGNGPGLGLLPLVTAFAPDKTVRRTQATFADLHGRWAALSGLAVSGYEIRHGQTAQHAGMAPAPAAMRGGLGWQNAEGNVLGVYLHGLFEDAGVLRTVRFGRPGPRGRVRGPGRLHRRPLRARGARQPPGLNRPSASGLMPLRRPQPGVNVGCILNSREQRMYKRILLAYDGSDAGQKALLDCRELAQWSGSELFLVAVMPSAMSFVGLEGGVYDVELEERERARYHAILKDGLHRLEQAGYAARGEVVTGEAIEEITKYARKVEADLIVVGHKHLSSWAARWWRGSISGALIEHSPCSVLAVITS